MTDMKTCKEFCKKLSDYLDGETDENECRLIAEHLDICAPCNQVYLALKTTVSLCEQGVPARAPDAVRRRLRTFLREHCSAQTK